MSWQHDHIIQHFKAWWKIANKLLRLFVENVEKNRGAESIFGNQFHFLLMSVLIELVVGNIMGKDSNGILKHEG